MNIVSSQPCCNHAPSTSSEVRVPSADIHETPDLIRVSLNVPGAGPDDLGITFENRTLTIAGKPAEATAGETKRGPIYQRSIVIPRDLNPAGLKATLRQGVLEIELPKATPPGAVTVPIGS